MGSSYATTTDEARMQQELSQEFEIQYTSDRFQFTPEELNMANFTASEINAFVEKMEDEYPTLSSGFKRCQALQYILFLQKHHDYGLHNIDMNEDISTPEGRILPTTALIIRIRDKVERMKNIVKKGVAMVGDESLMDTFKDLSVYGIIAQLINNGQWKRG